MGIPDRIYNLAKTQLDRALERWDEIDVKAQQELDEFIGRYGSTNTMSAWDRALSKINSASAEKELRSPIDQADVTASADPPDLAALEAKIAAQRSAQEIGPRPAATSPAQAQANTQTLVAAYKILGVEPGADWLTVQSAYQKLRERAAPERFPDESKEREAAKDIQRRIDSAYMMLSNVLAPSGQRFDRLEI